MYHNALIVCTVVQRKGAALTVIVCNDDCGIDSCIRDNTEVSSSGWDLKTNVELLSILNQSRVSDGHTEGDLINFSWESQCIC